jgi:hypothetical protein
MFNLLDVHSILICLDNFIHFLIYVHTQANNIIRRGSEQHTDRKHNNKQREYEQNNTQASITEIPIRGIRTRLFWTSGRRPWTTPLTFTATHHACACSITIFIAYFPVISLRISLVSGN